MTSSTAWTDPAGPVALIDQHCTRHTPTCRRRTSTSRSTRVFWGSGHLLEIQPGAFEQRLQQEFDAVEPDAPNRCLGSSILRRC